MKQESIYEISGGGGRFSYGVRLSKRGFLYKKKLSFVYINPRKFKSSN
jgi:hypothetical protein